MCRPGSVSGILWLWTPNTSLCERLPQENEHQLIFMYANCLLRLFWHSALSSPADGGGKGQHTRTHRAFCEKSARNKIIHAQCSHLHMYLWLCYARCSHVYNNLSRSRFASLPFACITQIPTFYQIFINLPVGFAFACSAVSQKQSGACTDFEEKTIICVANPSADMAPYIWN